MSRSRKKFPVFKDHRRNSHWFKRQASKAYRRRPIELSDTKPFHWYNPYDIHDYVIWEYDEDFIEKAFRK